MLSTEEVWPIALVKHLYYNLPVVFTRSLGGLRTVRECGHFPWAFPRVAQKYLHAQGSTLCQTEKCGLPMHPSIPCVPICLGLPLTNLGAPQSWWKLAERGDPWTLASDKPEDES